MHENAEVRMGTNSTYLAPKGLEIIAQGFNPGLTAMKRRALKAALVFGLRLPQMIECWAGYPPWIWCPFRAHRLKTPNPGLKPWAEIYCPFGAKTSSPERFINGGQFVTCAIGTNTNEC